MNIWMDALGDWWTTRPIRTSWECSIQLLPTPLCGFIGSLDHHFGNDSVWTRARTRCDCMETLRTLGPATIWEIASKEHQPSSVLWVSWLGSDLLAVMHIQHVASLHWQRGKWHSHYHVLNMRVNQVSMSFGLVSTVIELWFGHSYAKPA